MDWIKPPSSVPMKPFIDFAYLQVLDILTTLAFLLQGVTEANPLVVAAIKIAGPIGGLVLIKAAALTLAAVCFVQARYKLMQRVNVFFAFIVAMNLVALILSSASINP